MPVFFLAYVLYGRPTVCSQNPLGLCPFYLRRLKDMFSSNSEVVDSGTTSNIWAPSCNIISYPLSQSLSVYIYMTIDSINWP